MTNAEARVLSCLIKAGRRYRSHHFARGLAEIWYDRTSARFVHHTTRTDLETSFPIIGHQEMDEDGIVAWFQRGFDYDEVVSRLYVPVPSVAPERSFSAEARGLFRGERG